jgi:hypothetical protein
LGEGREYRRRSFRRCVLGCVVAAVAVVGGGGADASSADRPSARGGTRAPTVTAAGAATAAYLFKAEFGVGYEIDWTESSGNQADDCNDWRLSHGTIDVSVGSYDPKRKTSLALPGRAAIFRSNNVNTGWARLVAVGPAKGTVQRTLIETGGTTQCGNTPPQPFVAPANDCAGGRARPYSIPNASLRAAGGRGSFTLNEVTEINTPASSVRIWTIAISAAPLRSLYRNCRTSAYAPPYPASVGLPMFQGTIAALRKLKPGQKRRIERTWTGDCQPPDEISTDAACRFKLDLHVDIRRWRPGERFP